MQSKRRPRSLGPARLVLTCTFCLASCAPATPLFTGGSSTPRNRLDTLIGGALRLPFGELKNRSSNDPLGSDYRDSVEGSGMTPVALARYGLSAHTDIGLGALGSTLRLDTRHEWVLRDELTRPVVMVTPGFLAGWIPGDDGGNGVRIGGELPWLAAVDVGGVYEAWGGVRARGEHASGKFLNGGGMLEEASSTLATVGGVFGMGLGFRHLHVLFELTAGYEWWKATHGSLALDRSGLVLTPAFGLRLRL